MFVIQHTIRFIQGLAVEAEVKGALEYREFEAQILKKNASVLMLNQNLLKHVSTSARLNTPTSALSLLLYRYLRDISEKLIKLFNDLETKD